MNDLIKNMYQDIDIDINTKNAEKNRFNASKPWWLLQQESTKIRDLIKGGQVSVIDLSVYTIGGWGWGVKSLVTGLVTKKLFIVTITNL